MSCSISNSSQQLPGFAIRDISMSDPATELIPSPSDPKLLFAIVPIILLGLTIMPLIWLHFIKCRYPGVGSQFSILNYCSTDSKRVSILINLTHSTGCQLSSNLIHSLNSIIMPLASLARAMPTISSLFIVCGISCLLIMAIPAYSLYAAYPAFSLWLLHAYSVYAAYPACSLWLLHAYGFSGRSNATQFNDSSSLHYGFSQRSNAAHY